MLYRRKTEIGHLMSKKTENAFRWAGRRSIPAGPLGKQLSEHYSEAKISLGGDMRNAIFHAAILTCIAMISVSMAVAEKKEVHFRPNSSMGMYTNPGKGPKTLRYSSKKVVSLENRYIHRTTLRAIGGVLFLATAVPDDDIAKQCPVIGLSLSSPNGQRLTFQFPNVPTAHSTIYDWELAPAIDFVVAGGEGLFSYMRDEAEYHRAFINNLVGVELFLLDNAGVNEDFPSSHLIFDEDSIPGFPQVAPTEDKVAAWKEDRELLRHRHIIFWDRNVSFRFGLSQDKLQITGRPYWASVEEVYDEYNIGRIIETYDGSAVEFFSSYNPVIYSSVERLARHIALFRYMSATCAQQWQEFTSLFQSQQEKLDTIEIPRDEMPVQWKN
ncbi:hypothetical protein [Mesorhizobium sp. KR2-14]|uniref:hypothetical protein n=1 Tax=Mesorhizobium sp. KR2-14 TaxID=3156610 RepID=UPI0032B50871